MTAPLEQLQVLIPPPMSPVPTFDWTTIEQRLGLRLPDDYKRLVETYGPGSFDDFVWVLQPSETNEHVDLLRQRQVRLDALRAVQADGEELPYRVDPGDESLVPWAITDNGDVLYWVTDGARDPAEWTVAINEARGPRWEAFDGSAVACLLAVMSGSFRVKLFPDDFPSEQPTFLATTG